MPRISRRRMMALMAATAQPWRLACADQRDSHVRKRADDTKSRRDAQLAHFNALQLALVNLRFGMFIHFSPTTYLDPADHLFPDHAPPRQGKDGVLGTADDLSPGLMSPKKLDCGQWASVAVSANMRFGVLTTKHHDGFCLWPSKHSTYTVAQGCGRDIVGEFAREFRKRGLKVGFYYSIRDRTARIAGTAHDGGVSEAKIQLIKDELSELLGNYGKILYIVFDGWGNSWHESPTFWQIHYPDIYQHVKSLQPDCLVLNHTRIRYITDVPQLELRAGMEFPTGADWPAVGGNTLQETWFWRKTYPSSTLRSLDWIVNQNLKPDNERNVVFQLNCAPNRDGLMDENVVDRMAEVGRTWTPPRDLVSVPESWKNWPLPSTLNLFRGKDIAQGKPVRLSVPLNTDLGAVIVDGDPDTFIDLPGTRQWVEIDLGSSYDLTGLHLWNLPQVSNSMMERGFISISEEPFVSTEPGPVERSQDARSLAIHEGVGYPTPFLLGRRGRYIRVVSTSGSCLGLGEIEAFCSAT